MMNKLLKKVQEFGLNWPLNILQGLQRKRPLQGSGPIFADANAAQTMK